MYERKYFKIGKHRFSYALEPDEYSDKPWENSGYFGSVRELRNRNQKSPDERIFHSDRWYYLAVNWGSIARSDGPEIANAVFDRLRQWANDDWVYCVLEVIDNETGERSYLGMIESDSDESYIRECAFENAWEMLYARKVKIGISANHKRAKPRHGYNKTRFLEWSANNVG